MHPAVRTQIDNLGRFYSVETALHFPEDDEKSRSVTKQEFKDDTDIGLLLARHGVMQQQRPAGFGEVDYTLDLQQAFASIEQARYAYTKISPELQALYPNIRDFLNGMATGSVASNIDRLDAEKAKRAKETPKDDTSGVT